MDLIYIFNIVFILIAYFLQSEIEIFKLKFNKYLVISFSNGCFMSGYFIIGILKGGF